jgi:hypothetical protein
MNRLCSAQKINASKTTRIVNSARATKMPTEPDAYNILSSLWFFCRATRVTARLVRAHWYEVPSKP